MTSLSRKITHIYPRKSIFRLSGIIFLALTLVLLTPLTSVASPGNIIKEASSMIDQGNSYGAYELLEALEDEYAGWWEFDYVLGVAALESGQASLSILSLQRALAMNPNLVGAHIDLGRAYYEVKEYDPAKKEFELALSNKPNSTVEKIANTYLKLITAAQTRKSRKSSVHVSLGSSGGYDTNANSATNEKTFDGFELAEANIQTPSLFVAAQLGIQAALKVSQRDIAIFTADYTQRYNKDAQKVNYKSINALGLWKRKTKSIDRNIGIQIQKTELASDLASFVAAFIYSQSKPLYKSLHYDLYANLSNIDFGSQLPERNARQYIAGGGLSIKPNNSRSPTLSFSSLIGIYKPKEDDSTHEKTFIGGRIILHKRFKWITSGHYSLNGGATYSEYASLFSSTERNEALGDTSLNFVLNPTRHWELALKTTYTKTLSTVNLYEYSRLNTSAGIKYTF